MNPPILVETVRSALAADGAEAARRLTPLERRWCRALPDRRRPDFRAARLAAKRAVHRLLGCGGDRPLTIPPGGGRAPRPRLGGPGAPRGADLRVSLAHRDGRGAAAASRGGLLLGVDLERRGRVDPRQLRHFLGEEERAEAPSSMDPTELWAFKEAAWKALALRPSEPFHALALVFQDGELAELRRGPRRWAARGSILRPWPGYVVTLVRARALVPA